MRINCSLLYVLKNEASSFLATDTTHVHNQSAIRIFIWNLVADANVIHSLQQINTRYEAEKVT